MNSKRFNELPPEVRHAAHFGLGDPPDSGAVKTPEEAEKHYEAGRQVGELMAKATELPLPPLSDRAKTAPDADEHRELGPFPDDDPTYVR